MYEIDVDITVVAVVEYSVGPDADHVAAWLL